MIECASVALMEINSRAKRLSHAPARAPGVRGTRLSAQVMRTGAAEFVRMLILQDFSPRKLKQNWLSKYFCGGDQTTLSFKACVRKVFLIIKNY